MPDISKYGAHYQTVYIDDCKDGLGMKITEKFDVNNNLLGIYVKQILDNGAAASSGELCVGDKLLQVNDNTLDNVRQVEAISFLRNAVKFGSVKLVVDKSYKTQDTYLYEENMNLRKKSFNQSLARNGSLLSKRSINFDSESAGFTDNNSTLMSPAQSFKKAGRSNSLQLPRHLTASIDSGFPQNSPFLSSRTPEHFFNDQAKVISIPCCKTLGISVEQQDEHFVISKFIEGGDAARDGRLCIGDIILSLNGESFIGIEQAKSFLLKLKLKSNFEHYTISYLPSTSKTTSTQRKYQQLSTSQAHLDLASDLMSEEDSSLCDPLIQELLTVMSEMEDSDRASNIANEILELSQRNNTLLSSIHSPRHFINGDMSNKAPMENTISHYLNQDVHEKKLKHQEKKIHMEKTIGDFSLDPSTLIRIEKLEIALKHLGLQITSKERNDIRNKLKTNKSGLVLYGDFVAATRDILNVSLKDFTNTLNTNSTLRTINHSTPVVNQHHSATVNNQVVSTSSLKHTLQEELRHLRHERDTALKEARFLKSTMQEKDMSVLRLEKELRKYEQEVEAARDQVNALKRRVRLSESSHRTAKEQEHSYEEAIQKLEQEINNMKKQELPNTEEFVELQKRSVVLGCQLRKSEISKRTYEVAVNKLIKFATYVESTLQKEEKRNGKDNSNGKHGKNKEICENARGVIKVVNSLIEEDPLPYGWEEVYSPDGTKYYINHVNQLTSWSHPVSGVHHSSNNKPPRKGGQRT